MENYLEHYEKVLNHPHIRYELPMSKVVQAIKGNTQIETAWGSIKYFLSECTTAKINLPDTLSIEINSHKDRDTDLLEQSAQQIFGLPEKHFDGMFDLLRWKLKATQLENAVQFMMDGQPYPKAVRPFISCRIDYFFEFTNPSTQEALIGQEKKSHLAIFLERNSSCLPEFWFPFTTNGDDFYSYIGTLTPFFPFKKLDEKSFRIVAPNKQGTSNFIRKFRKMEHIDFINFKMK